MSELIEAADEIDVLNAPIDIPSHAREDDAPPKHVAKDVVDKIRQFRNLIHPARALRKGYDPSTTTRGDQGDVQFNHSQPAVLLAHFLSNIQPIAGCSNAGPVMLPIFTTATAWRVPPKAACTLRSTVKQLFVGRASSPWQGDSAWQTPSAPPIRRSPSSPTALATPSASSSPLRSRSLLRTRGSALAFRASCLQGR